MIVNNIGKLMYREKIIPCPLYSIQICFIASDSEEEVNKRRNLDMEGFGGGYATRQPIKLRGQKDREICIFIILNTDAKGLSIPLGPGTIAHECLHGCSFILEYVGIHATHGNDEAMAYLLQWLVTEAHKFYKPYIIDGK